MNTPRVFYRTGKFLEIHAPLVFATICIDLYSSIGKSRFWSLHSISKRVAAAFEDCGRTSEANVV